MIVGHGDKDVHQLHIHFQGGCRVLLWGVLSGSTALLRGGAQAKNRHYQHEKDTLHGGVIGHLDAPGSTAVPCPERISAGKGSPSAHTAPSSKYSFFQMGTVFFSVSITQRHASNAGPRCADADYDKNAGLTDLQDVPAGARLRLLGSHNASAPPEASSSICFSAIASYAS